MKEGIKNNEIEPLVSIIIVTWNNEDDIEECLESVLKQDYNNYNIIVVDNASKDRTVEIVDEIVKSENSNGHLNLHFIKKSENSYLPGGNNQGIKYAWDNFNSEFVMVLNPDTKVDSNLVKELVSTALTDEDIGAVGPKIKFYKTENNGKINSVGLFFDGFMQAYDIGFNEEDNGQFDKIEDRWGVSGTCILYRSEMLKEVGLYSEKIKLHLDEVELFIRINKRNWKAIYTPNSTVWHKYMVSTNKNPNYKISKSKKKTWLMIALKHYSLKSKVAMIKKYLLD